MIICNFRYRNQIFIEDIKFCFSNMLIENIKSPLHLVETRNKSDLLGPTEHKSFAGSPVIGWANLPLTAKGPNEKRRVSQIHILIADKVVFNLN